MIEKVETGVASLPLSSVARVFLASLVCLTFMSSAQARNCLSLSSPNDYLGLKVGEELEHLFALQSPCFIVSYNPAARSAQMLLDGEVDGELLRIEGFEPYKTADMVMVPVPLIIGEAILVTRDFKVSAIEDISQATLGIRRGTEWSDSLSQGHENTITVPSYELMVEMFKKGRIDAFLIDDLNLREYRDTLAGMNKVVLKQSGAYIWLSKEHENLVPDVARILREFYAQGHSFAGL
ncbi:hypothetical protein TH30_13315 [Thalassospira profundimaris]|uniref:Uncharacterized protein n=2 Tax=Thalassospira profundimaris TaxID=502049 RepID=A0A367WUD1_9PROT|nr:hypothetical protein TH30_13315 [Thalassospira profundimaris]